MNSTPQRNSATFRRWFDEGCSRGNVALVDELYAPDYVSHSLPPDLPPTRAGLRAFIVALREGIPDLACPIEHLVAEGDRSRVRSRCGAPTRAVCSGSRRRAAP